MRRHAKAIVAVSAMLLTLALGVTFAGAVPPVLTIDPASSVSYTSAHVSGTIDTEDEQAFYYFHYAKVGSGDWRVGAVQGPIPAGSGPENVSDDLTGLAAGTEYEVRLGSTPDFSAESFSPEPNPTFTTDPVDVPTVSIDPVSSITGDGAHFSGTINPNLSGGSPAELSDVDWHFECTPACPDAGSGTIAADAANHVVSGDATGLDPNTDFEVRLVAENAGPPVVDTASFKTSAPSPVVEVLPPAVITDTSAWIGGEVNPRNSATTYYIEYSSDPGFANSVSVPATQDASAGSGNQLVFVNHNAKGLQPGTTYYYRVVASGSGTTVGASESFETLAEPFPAGNVLPDGRVYERVSPVDKQGADIEAGSTRNALPLISISQATPSGEAVAFRSRGNVAGEGGPPIVQYIARRDADGWKTEGINPPQMPGFGSNNANVYFWLSEDLQRGLALLNGPLAPGDSSRTFDLYLRDFNSKTYQNISKNDGSEPTRFYNGYAVTENASHVLFDEASNFGNRTERLFEWTPEETREVGVLPNDMRVNAGLGTGQAEGQIFSDRFNFPGYNAMSEDGSHIFFSSDTAPDGSPSQKQLYLRINGESTIWVSKPERSTPDDFRGAAAFFLASERGETAFFASTERLTEDSNATIGQDLYRWDGTASEGSRLANLTAGAPDGGGVLGVLGGSDDAASVYFAARGALTDDAIEGQPNLYLWREGKGVTFVAALLENNADASNWAFRLVGNYTNEDESPNFSGARVTPDGRYLAFTSRKSLTAYDTNGHRQLYVYDSEAGTLGCASCSTFESGSTDSSWISSSIQETRADSTPRLPKNLSDDGSRLFFDSRDALVPTDTNGVTDVYMWSAGRLHLLSSGTSAVASRFLDASSDGDDAFFTTAQKLVLSDKDTLVDLYDARVGGREEPTVSQPCAGDECQGTPSAPPPFATPSSQSLVGPGSPKQGCRPGAVRLKGSCRKHQRGKRRCRATQKAAGKKRACAKARNADIRLGRGK